MNLIADLLSRFRRKPRAWWQAFDVSFDEHSVVIRERCPRKVREERFSWSSVRRVCFKDRGLSSDVFFVFTADRDGAFMVPWRRRVETPSGTRFVSVDCSLTKSLPLRFVRLTVRTTAGRKKSSRNEAR